MTRSLSDGSGAAARGTPDGWRESIWRFFAGRSLEACVNSGRDNILELRLLAALMVVLGHSYVLVGHNEVLNDPIHRLLPKTGTHLVGVMMFFVISGFLVTLSYQRRPQFGRFLLARALRIWPALIVCAGAWSFVLGPMLSTLPLHDYFAKGDNHGTASQYFWRAVLLWDIWPFLPGVFANTPIPYQVNASLWTIPYETKLYLFVAAAGVLGLFRFRWLASVVIAGVFTWLVLWPMYKGTAPGTVAFFGLQLSGVFGAASITCLFRRYVPISTGLLILIVAAYLFERGGIHQTPFMWLAVGYFVFWFAYVPRLPTIPKGLDLSYGSYLWAFPIQQAMITLTGTTNPLVLFVLVTPLVLVTALLSWLYVEKPALRLKKFRWSRAAATGPTEDRVMIEISGMPSSVPRTDAI